MYGRSRTVIQPWFFAGPALLVFVLTVMVPIIWSVGYSFYDWKALNPMQFVGLANYRYLLSDPVFRTTFLNNLIFSVFSTCYQLVVGLVFAVILTAITRMRNILRVLYFIPCVVSTAAVCQVFNKLLSRNPVGVVNFVLDQLFGQEAMVAFLADPKITLLIVAWVDGYKFCALYMIIYYSAFVALSSDVLEAARIDGCNGVQLFFRIKFPLIKNVFFMTVVMLVNGTLKSFDIAYILTQGGPGYSSELVATNMYKVAFNHMNFGYGSTIAVFLVVECLVAVSLIRKFTPQSDVV